jgi:hypothetical protein
VKNFTRKNLPRSVQDHTLSRNTLSRKQHTRLNPLSFFTMGNKKNIRKRIPTAKKLAADPAEDSDSPPPQTSTRPKPRPTWKGATKDPKPARVEASESDASMDDDDDAGEDEDMEAEVDENWDELPDEDEIAEEIKARQSKATARSAPGM